MHCTVTSDLARCCQQGNHVDHVLTVQVDCCVSMYREENSRLQGAHSDVLQFLHRCMDDLHREMLSGETGTGTGVGAQQVHFENSAWDCIHCGKRCSASPSSGNHPCVSDPAPERSCCQTLNQTERRRAMLNAGGLWYVLGTRVSCLVVLVSGLGTRFSL